MNRGNTFYFQGILFANEINHRVLQNENGPCPLLALINCMLLDGRLRMAIQSLSGTYPISFKALTQCLQNELQNVSDKLWEDGSEVSEAKMIAIAECMDIFPTLERGLDINIKFNDVQSFDMKELAHQFFDIYDLNIYHCWVMDPDGRYGAIYPLIADKTYDEVQDMLLNTDSQHYALIHDFLQHTKQQQTKYGVHRLYATMKDDEIATLFHNNHYSTIHKHSDDHLIYELVTDEGIVSEESNIIWKTFNPSNYIDGMDEIFVDANFNALNQFDVHQLTKLRKIIHCLRKYKYNINRTLTPAAPPPSEDSDTELHLLLKKVENTLEFIDKFPFNPLQCKMIFEEDATPRDKRKKYEIKDDLKMKKMEMDLMGGPQTMKRAMSDNVTSNHLGSILGHKNTSDEYKIRNCRVEDIAIICKEFGYSNYSSSPLNQRFWTKEFLTKNTDRNGYVLEDHDSANIIGFILYERCEPLGDMVHTGAHHTKTDQLLLRDLSASTSISNDIDMHCKWKVTDWSSSNNGKISFYSQFILITDLGIHPKCRKKGYGSKLLQSIIYSFPSGTRFAVEIESTNESAIHCFGKCGFVIKRMENKRFYMTASSDYNIDDVATFKKSSILKHDKKQIIRELKESNDKIKLKMQQQTQEEEEEKAHEEEDDEEIFIKIPQTNDEKESKTEEDPEAETEDRKYEEDEKDERTTEELQFSPEKLNRLCSELCCMEHSMLVQCVLCILDRVIDDVYIRLDYDDVIRDMKTACYDPYGDNAHTKSVDDTDRYVELALAILYCAGFVKRRFADVDDDRFYLSLADESDIWKLEATHELIGKYNLNMHSKKNRMDLLKAITLGANPSRHWKHIFDADAHGQIVRDRTIRLLKKICRGIIKNKDDLSHKTRNLNYSSLRTKFDCQIPLLLLQKCGFEQRENLYKAEIRFIYRHKDIEPIKEMLSKIEYEEKCMSDQDIFSSMPQRLQMLWIHVLSSIHGEQVRTITIQTIKRVCTNIITQPAILKHRNLDLLSLQRKFHCGVPVGLLMEYGFTKSMDPYRFDGGALRLRFDSSDITQCKTLLNILEKGEKMNVNDILNNRDQEMATSVDQLRLIMALKALKDNQHMMNMWNANDMNINMTPLTQGTHDGGTGDAFSRRDTQDPDRILSAFNNNNNNNNYYNDDFKQNDMNRNRNMNMNMDHMNDMNTAEMTYIEMRSFLGHIGLENYAGSFINNGIKTKKQLLEVDVSLIEFFIDNKPDQNKFINWLNTNKQETAAAAANIGGISGI